MARTKTTEGQALWQPGRAKEDSRFRGGNGHLRLAYEEEEEEDMLEIYHSGPEPSNYNHQSTWHMYLYIRMHEVVGARLHCAIELERARACYLNKAITLRRVFHIVTFVKAKKSSCHFTCTQLYLPV